MDGSQDEQSPPDIEQRVDCMLGQLARHFRGYKPREAQRRMAIEVASSFTEANGHQRLMACEAPTGTGKSLAYLTGAMAAREISSRPIVICTATVVLQEQLVKRDLPAFLHALGLAKTTEVALAKGMGRYGCLQHIEQAIAHEANGKLDFGGDSETATSHWPRQPRPGELAVLAARLDEGRGGHWDGDLDDTPSIKPDLHRMVGARSASCLGARCPDAANCGMLAAKDRARDADIVVANHDLLLACIAHGAPPWFADLEEAYWIFDEAHALPEKAQKAFSGNFLPPALTREAETIKALIAPTEAALRASASESESLRQAHKAAGTLQAGVASSHTLLAAQTLESNLDKLLGTLEDYRFGIQSLPQAIARPIETVHDAGNEWRDHARTIAEALKRGQGARRNHKLAMAWSASVERLGALERATALPLNERIPTVCWADRTRSGTARFHAAPLLPGAMLHHAVWKQDIHALFTSATLRAPDTFERFQYECGLGRKDSPADFLALPSPFDLSRSTLAVLQSSANPNEEAHNARIARAAKALMDATEAPAGLLFIATSWRMLGGVKEALEGYCEYPIHAQGEQPKSKLIAAHRKVVRAGSKSMLFGLASFAEGLDLPGDTCRIVVLGKLPFTVPNDPIESGRAEFCRSRGRDPFLDIAMPTASRKVIQICGRLVRAPADCGLICVMDPRMTSKPYGKAMRNALVSRGYMGAAFTTPRELGRLLVPANP
jgi:ATP-dependent DNA helicase DinG